MKRLLTTLAFLGVAPYAASAQTIFDVSVKQIFAVPSANLQQAASLAAAGTLTNPQYEALTRSRYVDRVSPADTLVRFTGVVLSDPLNSGLASPNNGRPARIHVFVRDVKAAQDANGMRGYVAQIVDGSYDTDGLEQVAPGAVVSVTGSLGYFNGEPQIAPTSLSIVAPDLASAGLPATLDDPIAIASITDLNIPNGVDGSGRAQATLNFANFNPNANEYISMSSVRVENTSAFAANLRFNIIFSNPERTAFIDFRDVSLRFRNDRDATYRTGFNVRTDAYVPPSIGANVSIRGFTLASTSDFPSFFSPDPHISFVPMDDADIQVQAGSPPSVANVMRSQDVPTGSTPLTITTNATPAGTATIASVMLKYSVNGGPEQSVAMSLTSGTQYSGSIPASALADGAFVTYKVMATDNAGTSAESVSQSTRVLSQGVRRISHLQQTASGSIGDSPFVGAALTASNLNITAVVMTDYAQNQRFVTVQDDAALAPWSGIALRLQNTTAYDAVRALVKGTQITITGGTVLESNGLTLLDNVVFTTGAVSGAYGDKTVTTTEMTLPSTAETHESMRVRFNNVQVSNVNPDAPSNFGEVSVMSVGGTGDVRVDDLSAAIEDNKLFVVDGLNPTVEVGDRVAYVAGMWTYSFNNFKLEPETPADIGAVTPTASEEDVRASGFGVLGAAPNPVRGTARVRFLATGTDAVRLDVYDVLGRRVASLASGVVATGEQSAMLDASGLAPGVYVLRLTQGARTSSQTFMVAR